MRHMAVRRPEGKTTAAADTTPPAEPEPQSESEQAA